MCNLAEAVYSAAPLVAAGLRPGFPLSAPRWCCHCFKTDAARRRKRKEEINLAQRIKVCHWCCGKDKHCGSGSAIRFTDETNTNAVTRAETPQAETCWIWNMRQKPGSCFRNTNQSCEVTASALWRAPLHYLRNTDDFNHLRSEVRSAASGKPMESPWWLMLYT